MGDDYLCYRLIYLLYFLFFIVRFFYIETMKRILSISNVLYRFLDLLFILMIQCTCRLIKYQYSWPFDQCSCYCKPLFLTSGQHISQISNICVKTVFKLQHEFSIGYLKGFDYFIVGDSWPSFLVLWHSIDNVLSNGLIEKDGFLTNVTNV